MAETDRTEAALLALMQVGVSGAIGAQDIRDAIYSIYRRIEAAASGSDAQYGDMYWATPAATTLAQGVWTKAAGTTTLSQAVSFTMPANNRLRHDDAVTELYRVSVDFTLTCGANNQTIWTGISRNGAEPDVASRRYVRIATGADAATGAAQGLFELDATDYVELWVMNETAGNTVTIERGCLMAVKVT